MQNLPVVQPKPDVERFVDVLMGRDRVARPPLVEYLVDDVLRKPITTDLLGRTWVDEAGDRESQARYLDNFVEFWYRMGYDFVRFERGLDLPQNRLLAGDTAPGATKPRAWADEHQGCIATWEDFERYPWPKIEETDFFGVEYLNAHLPEGMGLITCHAGGLFERLSWIMSLEGLCLALYDNPGLVKAVVERLSELMTAFYRHLLDLDHLAAIFQGDDMGFRSGTLIDPSDLRKYTLPWHKCIAAMAHGRGIPYFLHSCGNLAAIMEDLITEVGIDGKHSYEDAIMPVQDFQARYGDRIAVLGGVDINILAAAPPEKVRARTRFLMETCGRRGRYAIGSGNSVPSYIPVANYLAMVDEAMGNAGD